MRRATPDAAGQDEDRQRRFFQPRIVRCVAARSSAGYNATLALARYGNPIAKKFCEKTFWRSGYHSARHLDPSGLALDTPPTTRALPFSRRPLPRAARITPTGQPAWRPRWTQEGPARLAVCHGLQRWAGMARRARFTTRAECSPPPRTVAAQETVWRDRLCPPPALVAT
jgi:hypothetical protein